MFEPQNMIEELVFQEEGRPELLYHYCKKESAKYLLGYGADISARSLLKSPNDDMEYRAGVKLFCRYVREHGILSEVIANLLYERILGNILRGELNRSPVVPFAFCLTSTFNSSYHWSEFLKNEGGYSFAFSTNMLQVVCQDVVRQHKASLELARCYYVGYDDDVIDALFRSICTDRKEDFISLERTKGNDSAAAIRIILQVCMLAMRIKDARFYPEQEWRIVMISSNSSEANQDGYLQTGMRDSCIHGDVMTLMRGVISSPKGNQVELQRNLFELMNTRNGKPFYSEIVRNEPTGVDCRGGAAG